MDDFLREIETSVFREWINNQKEIIIIFIKVKLIQMQLL